MLQRFYEKRAYKRQKYGKNVKKWYGEIMAKISYLDIEPELEEAYFSGIQSQDRFIIPRVRVKKVILSQKKIEDLEARSFLPAIAVLWNAFSDAERLAWKNADPYPHPNGWRAFVADQSKRISLGIGGVATPNEFHQDLVGKILIEEPAEEIKIIQPHPSNYWIYQKVVGTKSMYEPVEINEVFGLPLKITINYKSDLTSTGEGSFARFYASIRHLYQAQNLNHDEIIEIPLDNAWASQNKTVSVLAGVAVSYNLYIHLYKVRGTLLIDNVKAEHSASNWARDTFCKKIEQDFTRQFYQIPRHWGVITMPEGAGYQSIYPT